MQSNIDFYTSIDDLIDIDVSYLKKDIKDEGIKGKPVLIAENDHGVLTVFFETKDGVSFYNWSAPTGFSREYKASSLMAAESRASCMGMYISPTGLVKAETAHYGQKEINQKKLGIDWKVGE